MNMFLFTYVIYLLILLVHLFFTLHSHSLVIGFPQQARCPADKGFCENVMVLAFVGIEAKLYFCSTVLAP